MQSQKFPYSVISLVLNKAKSMAIIWTLLIFLLCFIPIKEMPTNIPLGDKITHFILFAVFSLLWLMVANKVSWKNMLLVFIAGSALGWLVEELQGMLSFLGRSKDVVDTYADIIGAAIGVIAFYILHETGLLKPEKWKP